MEEGGLECALRGGPTLCSTNARRVTFSLDTMVYSWKRDVDYTGGSGRANSLRTDGIQWQGTQTWGCGERHLVLRPSLTPKGKRDRGTAIDPHHTQRTPDLSP